MSTNESDQGKGYEREKAYKDVEQQGFSLRIWALSAIGFFANSYSIFSMKAILPLLAFSNWKSSDIRQNEIKLKAAIVTGSIIGQLVFGYFADRYGRLKFYGYYFISLAYVTICFAQSSSGLNSMSMLVLLMIWGFVAGVINGAAQPLAATITAEFAPTQSRARMMAAVFLMQPLGQLAVSVMSVVILQTVGKSNGLSKDQDHVGAVLVVDTMWRLLIVVNAVPAFITFLVRFTCPESPGYILEVDDNRLSDSELLDVRRTAAAGTGHNEAKDTLLRFEVDINSKVLAVSSNEQTISSFELAHKMHEAPPSAHSYKGIKEYFWTQGNWRRLLATCACWFLFGIASSGFGISNPRILARFWNPSPFADSTTTLFSQIDPEYSNSSIYGELMQDSIRMIIVIFAKQLLGSIILVSIIDYIPRKKMLAWTYLGLAVLFAITGGLLFNTSPLNFQPVIITLYITYQILCNFGLNPLIFIVSGILCGSSQLLAIYFQTNRRDFFIQITTEIFPTCYRTTCHGISAAYGTLGSLFVMSCVGIDDSNAVDLRGGLIISSVLMAFGAAFAWKWIPEVQDSQIIDKGYKIPSKSLEALGTGNTGMKAKDI